MGRLPEVRWTQLRLVLTRSVVGPANVTLVVRTGAGKSAWDRRQGWCSMSLLPGSPASTDGATAVLHAAVALYRHVHGDDAALPLPAQPSPSPAGTTGENDLFPENAYSE